MRIWTLHPRYLDPQGLVALWREGLLAKKVLEKKTKGYKNHPQLNRFKSSKKPLSTIKTYLHFVCDEAEIRGYTFDRSKLGKRPKLSQSIKVKSGQVQYEWEHLMKKLKLRNPKLYHLEKEIKRPLLHPLFKKIRGGIESWEVITSRYSFYLEWACSVSDG